jgi:hypothetical protein
MKGIIRLLLTLCRAKRLWITSGMRSTGISLDFVNYASQKVICDHFKGIAMPAISLKEAKAGFSNIVDQAAAGEL